MSLTPFAGDKSKGGAGPGKPGESPSGQTKQESIAAGVPLGKIIPRKFSLDSGGLILNAPHSSSAERYRRLVSKLEHGIVGQTARMLLITSATPGEGKTTTALNLGMAFAENKDLKTVLVDADMRRPSIGKYLIPKASLGLSEVLSGDLQVQHAVVETADAGMTILPAGKPVANPLGLLRSDRLAAILAELRQTYDRIILDSPPVVPFADAAVLNGHADGALLIVRAEHTTRPMISKAVEILSDGNLLGTVLNDVRITVVDRYYYKYDEYDPDKYRYRDDGKED